MAVNLNILDELEVLHFGVWTDQSMERERRGLSPNIYIYIYVLILIH
jgi:hypothetical protein